MVTLIVYLFHYNKEINVKENQIILIRVWGRSLRELRAELEQTGSDLRNHLRNYSDLEQMGDSVFETENIDIMPEDERLAFIL